MIEKLFFLSLLTVAVLFSPRAGAVMNLEPMVPGLQGGLYKPLSVPALTGANFSATGQVLVNGRFVPIPGYIPPAGTAAAAARSSLWLNPWLVGASLLAWSGDAGLHSDEVGGWMYTDPNGGAGPSVQAVFPVDATVIGCRCASGNCTCDSSMQACAVNYAPLGVSDRYCYAFRGTDKLGVYAGYKQDYYGTPITGATPAGETPYGSCSSGYAMSSGTTSCDPVAENRPATQADFDALPAPPAAALADLAPQVGVLVDDPVYSPADVAIGDPYTRADGSTAQPRAKISPAGNGQVYVDTYEMPLTDSTGAPVANPAPQDTPEPPPPSPTQCDKYPNTLGCANLDIPVSEDMPTQVRDIALISPVSVGGAGSCPAPLTATVMGHVVEMSFDPLCQYANALRPLVLALAWLSAGVLFIGGVRNG